MSWKDNPPTYKEPKDIVKCGCGVNQPMPPEVMDGDDKNLTPEEKYQKQIAEQQNIIAKLQHELAGLLLDPLMIADVVRVGNQIEPNNFKLKDKCLIIDEESRYHQEIGTITEEPDEVGLLELQLVSGLKRKFNIGIADQKQEVKLLGKDDGTNVVVAVNGEHYEVLGKPELNLQPGQPVKICSKSKQIVSPSDISRCGEIADVIQVIDENTYEVYINNARRVVLAGPPKVEPIPEEDRVKTVADGEEEAELSVVVENEFIDGQNLREVQVRPGDRLLLDKGGSVVLRHLPKDDSRHKLDGAIDITFKDIAGCEKAKEAIRESIEYPIKYKDLYSRFNKAQSKGVLLYGPPGNGKTLLGKALTKMLADLHGNDDLCSGFIYVKGPELLDRWVGSSEQQIRALFQRGKDHYEKHKYPAVLFIDEADAILPKRGRRNGDWDIADSVVPMFLSEMDGLQESHVFVVLATNRPNLLDPAAIREGRCDQHIKVDRPNVNSAAEYFLIHMRDIPFEGLLLEDENYKEKRKELSIRFAAIATAEIFNANRTLYSVTDTKVSKEHRFCFGDIISGSMIKGIVEEASSIAMRRVRDTDAFNTAGLNLQDLRLAVDNIYKSHAARVCDADKNFDIEDFCDKHGINLRYSEVKKLIA